MVAAPWQRLVKAGDLVEVKDNAAIPALRGSVGVVIRSLGRDMTQNITGTEESDCFYYEVNLAANGTQVLLDKELTLIVRAERKKNENR
jgi:high-affinity K+ transport system ATPase subunit B